jgi:quinol monooxygenase YgiN
MNAKQFLIIFASVLISFLSGPAVADESRRPFVRLAELEVDPAQLGSFKAAIQEGIETSVRTEPGVLVLYAVSEKDNPSRVIVFEIYSDGNAYAAHLETPHFKKFRATTEKMVKSRKLADVVPIMLGAKPAGADTPRDSGARDAIRKEIQ